MGVLEIIAERQLGAKALRTRPELRRSLTRLDRAAIKKNGGIARAERERLASIVELFFEYGREPDPEERRNILGTLEEISANDPLELPDKTVEDWERGLRSSDEDYNRADAAAERKATAFLSKYFSLRAKAGLRTQADVARSSGLRRSYVAVIECGEHVPQQKTLQKLAKAFRVPLSELL